MISRASVINRTSIDREHNPADNNASPRDSERVYISHGDNEVFVDLRPLLHQVFPQARFMRFMHDALIIYCYLYLCLAHRIRQWTLKSEEVRKGAGAASKNYVSFAAQDISMNNVTQAFIVAGMLSPIFVHACI